MKLIALSECFLYQSPECCNKELCFVVGELKPTAKHSKAIQVSTDPNTISLREVAVIPSVL